MKTSCLPFNNVNNIKKLKNNYKKFKKKISVLELGFNELQHKKNMIFELRVLKCLFVVKISLIQNLKNKLLRDES